MVWLLAGLERVLDHLDYCELSDVGTELSSTGSEGQQVLLLLVSEPSLQPLIQYLNT